MPPPLRGLIFSRGQVVIEIPVLQVSASSLQGGGHGLQMAGGDEVKASFALISFFKVLLLIFFPQCIHEFSMT